MNKLWFIILVAIILPSCDNADPLDKEERKITKMVYQVSKELAQMGFPISFKEITIRVEKAEDMAQIFNNLIDQSQDNYALGPENKGAEFTDGINTRLAFYDPNSKTIILKHGVSDYITKGYLAHELAHVYQDQQWGFANIWQNYRDDPTRELFNITQYLIEGYAELVRKAYEQAQEKSSALNRSQTLELGRILENDCLICEPGAKAGDMPYSMGLRFLTEQYRRGGWSLVDQFMSDFPDSSEQIIHPKKYDVDRPTQIKMPEWEEGSAILELDGRMGEASLLNKLLELSVPSEDALEAASGWDGDNSQLYLTEDGRELQVWRIIFDRVTDAIQFESTLMNHINRSDIFRAGHMVDWLISNDTQLKKEARIFFSMHLMNIKSDVEDEESTMEQELAIKKDVTSFDNPYLSPRQMVGPKFED